MTIFGPEGIQELTSLDSERLAKGVTNTVQALCPALHQFHQLLIEPPKVILQVICRAQQDGIMYLL